MYEVKLRDYLPQVVKDIREFQAITDAEQPEAEQLFMGAMAVLDNQFLDTLDDVGCSRWEQMLGIQPKLTDDLAVRRFRIKSRLNEHLPYTLSSLAQALDALCGKEGYTIRLYHTEYRLCVLLELTVKKLFDEVLALITRMIPANLLLEVILRYNQWQDVIPMTWQQAGVYTWGQIREEEI